MLFYLLGIAIIVDFWVSLFIRDKHESSLCLCNPFQVETVRDAYRTPITRLAQIYRKFRSSRRSNWKIKQSIYWWWLSDWKSHSACGAMLHIFNRDWVVLLPVEGKHEKCLQFILPSTRWEFRRFDNKFIKKSLSLVVCLCSDDGDMFELKETYGRQRIYQKILKLLVHHSTSDDILWFFSLSLSFEIADFDGIIQLWSRIPAI